MKANAHQTEMDREQSRELRYSGAIEKKQAHEWQSKIDEPFASLEQRGIVCRHDFSDCITGGSTEIRDEMMAFAMANKLVPIGYAFYHGQDTWDASECGELLLAFGCICATDEAAAEVGKIVRDVFAQHGLSVDWNGDVHSRIRVVLANASTSE